jgi:hypothetical protein
LQTFVRRIEKILNNQVTMKKMMGRERNLDCGIKRYREMILDAAETFLRFFGLIEVFIEILRRQNSMDIKGMVLVRYNTCIRNITR